MSCFTPAALINPPAHNLSSDSSTRFYPTKQPSTGETFPSSLQSVPGQSWDANFLPQIEEY